MPVSSSGAGAIKRTSFGAIYAVLVALLLVLTLATSAASIRRDQVVISGYQSISSTDSPRTRRSMAADTSFLAGCASWCNAYVCDSNKCSDCSVCEKLADGAYCSGWCNPWTCSMRYCTGCDTSICPPPGETCPAWCNRWTCATSACSGCSMCKQHTPPPHPRSSPPPPHPEASTDAIDYTNQVNFCAGNAGTKEACIDSFISTQVPYTSSEAVALAYFARTALSTNFSYDPNMNDCTPAGACPAGQIATKFTQQGAVAAANRQLAPYGMQYDATASRYVDAPSPGKCQNSTRGYCYDELPPPPPPTPVRLALYHGGVVAAAKRKEGCYRDYLDSVIKFATQPDVDIGILYVVLSAPIVYPAKPYKNQFAYYQSPGWLARNFLDKLPPSMTAGTVAYINPRDSSWDYKADGLRGGWGLGGSPAGCGTYEDLVPSPAAGCPVDINDNSVAGCPNIAAQVMAYMAEANRHAKVGGARFTYMSFDGEDGGNMASPWGLCQLKIMADHYGIPNVGMAKSMEASPVGTGLTYTLAETYWYMGELWPCGGDAYQLKKKVPVCTNLTSYSAFKDKPNEYLQYLPIADGALNSPRGFPSMVSSITEAKAVGKQVLPMFSIEGLSLTSKGGCLATYFAGAGAQLKSQVCGTFDGFSMWSWPTFKLFLQQFAAQYDVDTVGIYESQFIPPDWMDGGYGSNYNCYCPVEESDTVACTFDPTDSDGNNKSACVAAFAKCDQPIAPGGSTYCSASDSSKPDIPGPGVCKFSDAFVKPPAPPASPPAPPASPSPPAPPTSPLTCTVVETAPCYGVDDTRCQDIIDYWLSSCPDFTCSEPTKGCYGYCKPLADGSFTCQFKI